MGLINEGKEWIKAGGYLDFTADTPSENGTTFALEYYKNNNVNLTHVTLSSDAYGSSPVYNSNGQLISYEYASPRYFSLIISLFFFIFILILFLCNFLLFLLT